MSVIRPVVVGPVRWYVPPYEIILPANSMQVKSIVLEGQTPAFAFFV